MPPADPMTDPAEDRRFMAAAIALSERGRGLSTPNPNVGCLIVRDGRVVGRGWTQKGGRPHAEAQALEQAMDRAHGATAYVTLEPCFHLSPRGPRCADLLARAGIRRAVIALRDPDPRTNGQGAAWLRDHGVAVEMGLMETQARAAMAGFVLRQTRGRPAVTLKLGLSLDGRIALPDGSSRWITGPDARAHAHLERARHDAILVGGGTLRCDAPRLDVRLPGMESRSPRRILLSRGEAPSGWERIKRPEDIAALDRVDHLLVEGGAQTAAAFLRAGLVDRLLLYRAPILIGEGLPGIGDIGLADLAQAHGRWALADERHLGVDRLEVYAAARSA
ncbi:diaminohydroxyphosphoribosylaminopyrimidine deaminase/5-amino-6-(5-phosphoribosylamino)uracil reductase [Sphingobium wenxiniae]|uniref:Riboflavin biosynthesis protein RibD n=1 Tax=Sphingobium wenxiniae (strain DSM 21828 / CGMCC 1.7748 / JZ-1) TaxID=595605 RepID=A0A562KAN5_SPHWJ|nr:bifunctional diaminohydroxyphosphoribosylaminopyrimidine deaminase/5-amino-6-(5-phosphoribosylamino)uracil reductase RibD [Sphingobium wenxiniae]MBB6192078.1 diaminohydroxyphosphoribosylaminopyrimidine deaminase/5-amino-6-(5-phosphoribosylamino)uracil reductase [Sphingobium wenxiniae]TWH92456.1 diaminohydroxyphosphoribosylaminopyrimidine deaminase [Sphingobium wenxiniae]